MPRKLKRECRQSGCKKLTHQGWCDAHLYTEKRRRWKAADKARGNARERGYTSTWDKVARLHKRNFPLCVQCEKNGRAVVADEVDHIVPVSEAPDRVYDTSNLQSLCKQHHAIKTRRDTNRHKKKKERRIGRNGVGGSYS